MGITERNPERGIIFKPLSQWGQAISKAWIENTTAYGKEKKGVMTKDKRNSITIFLALTDLRNKKQPKQRTF